jgi:O-antigen/teichoic acid export membrane protein
MIRLSRTAIDSVWVSAGSYAMFAAMFGVTVIINRGYGTAELGRFGIAWAIAQLTIQACASGVQGIHRREVAYNRRAIPELVSETLAVRLLSLLVIIAISGAVLACLNRAQGFAIPVFLVLVAKTIETIGVTLAETLQASGKNRRYALLSTFNALSLLIAVCAVWYCGLSSTSIYFAVITAAVLYTIVSLISYSKVHGRPMVYASRGRMKTLVQDSWPLIINAIVFVAVSRIAVVVVGTLTGEVQAGVYTFASGVVGGLAVAASACGMVIFPDLCQTFATAPGALRGKMFRLAGRFAVIGVGAFALLSLVQGLIVQIYGTLPAYASSVVMSLGAGLIPTFATVSASYMFTAIGQQKEGMYVAFLNAALVISLLFPLTHHMGALGAAIAVATAQGIMCIVVLLWLDRRHLAKMEAAAAAT